jgi:hypothetical protein
MRDLSKSNRFFPVGFKLIPSFAALTRTAFSARPNFLQMNETGRFSTAICRSNSWCSGVHSLWSFLGRRIVAPPYQFWSKPPFSTAGDE